MVTKASVRPSGDHTGESFRPRAKNMRDAGLLPSIGATQISLSFSKATRLPSGEGTGRSPSPISTGAPPLPAPPLAALPLPAPPASARTAQICCFG